MRNHPNMYIGPTTGVPYGSIHANRYGNLFKAVYGGPGVPKAGGGPRVKWKMISRPAPKPKPAPAPKPPPPPPAPKAAPAPAPAPAPKAAPLPKPKPIVKEVPPAPVPEPPPEPITNFLSSTMKINQAEKPPKTTGVDAFKRRAKKPMTNALKILTANALNL